MTNESLRQEGTGNIQFHGDRNQVGDSIYNIASPAPLERTLVGELLRQVMPDPSSDGIDSLDIEMLPAELNDKLVYNNCPRYRLIFAENSINMEVIGEVLGDMPRAELLVIRLHKLYLRKAKITDEILQVSDGDTILDEIKEELHTEIVQDERRDLRYTYEHVDEFLDALLAYGVSVCKILVNPSAA